MPSSAATRSWSRLTDGSSPNWSSPTRRRGHRLAHRGRRAGHGVGAEVDGRRTGVGHHRGSVRRRGVGVGSRRCPPITRSSAATCPTSRGARPRSSLARHAAGALPAGDRRADPRGAPGTGRRRSRLVLGRRRRRHRHRLAAPADAGRSTSRGGPAWARWWIGGAFNYAARGDRAARRARPRRRGARLGGRGRRGPAADERGARARRSTRRPRTLAGRTASGRATGSGSSCRCSSRRSSRSLALGRLGAIFTPIFSGYGGAGRRDPARDCEASVLITADGFLRRGGVGAAEGRRRRGRRGGAVGPPRARRPPARATRVDDAVDAGPRPLVGRGDRAAAEVDARPIGGAAPTDPETPYMLIYTSGTTGRPKGAVHVHGGFPIKAAQDLAHTFDLRPRRRAVLVHRPRLDDGAVGDLRVAAARRPARAVRGRARLPGPGPALGARRAPPGHPPGPVADRHPGADRPRRRSRSAPTTCSSLRVLGSTGEPWNPDPLVVVLPRGRRRAAARSSTTRAGPRSPAGSSAGNLLGADQAGVVLRARASGRRPTSSTTTAEPVRGAVGELVIRAPMPGMTRGFWRDPRALRRDVLVAASRAPGSTATGRSSTRTASGTSTAAPTTRSRSPASASGRPRSRARPSSHPAVVEAAAIGVPHEIKGEAIVVALRPAPRARRTTRTLRAAIAATRRRASSARPLKPEAVAVVPALPKTRSGKVMRRVVRAAWLGLDPGDLSALDDPATLEAIRRAGANGAAPAAVMPARSVIRRTDRPP